MTALYAARVDALSAAVEDYDGRIAPGSLSRLAARPEGDRRRSLGAALLLEYAAARHLPQLPHPVERAEREWGKPYLPNAPGFHFSLSHAGDWAVCAVSDVLVGVDLERERRLPPRLAAKFAPEEREMLAALSEREAQRAIFRLWTCKEAYTKCTGRGLLCPFSSFLAERPAPGYAVQVLPFPGKGYHLALCLHAAACSPMPVQLMELGAG